MLGSLARPGSRAHSKGEMRFVEPKTAQQQARVTLFRTREQLVRQRTQLINALRSQPL